MSIQLLSVHDHTVTKRGDSPQFGTLCDLHCDLLKVLGFMGQERLVERSCAFGETRSRGEMRAASLGCPWPPSRPHPPNT